MFRRRGAVCRGVAGILRDAAAPWPGAGTGRAGAAATGSRRRNSPAAPSPRRRKIRRRTGAAEPPSRAAQPEAPTAAARRHNRRLPRSSPNWPGGWSAVVVNVSTAEPRRRPPARPGAGRAAQIPPGAPLDDFFRDFFGDKGGARHPRIPRAASLGSGFIIDPAGLIVTNNHVIANAEQITVTLSDDTTLQAQVIGRDAGDRSRAAQGRAEERRCRPPIGAIPSKTRVGDWVLAIGNPFGLGGTRHRRHHLGRRRATSIPSPYDDYLQTDASINRGNSGGPMFNLAGEVIGINTAIYSPSGGSIGIGFAMPSAFAQPIIEQLKATGKVERGWIGARIQPVTDEIAESVGLEKSRGAMIAAVDPGSPAAQAKLQPGDVILQL